MYFLDGRRDRRRDASTRAMDPDHKYYHYICDSLDGRDRGATPRAGPADVNRGLSAGLCRVSVQVRGQMLTGARLDVGPRADARSRLLGELAAAPARKGYGCLLYTSPSPRDS